MGFKGVVRSGVVVLDKGISLEEGTIVTVEPSGSHEELPTLVEIFKDVAGKAVGLPADMARNHDHYLYGCPKRDEE